MPTIGRDSCLISPFPYQPPRLFLFPLLFSADSPHRLGPHALVRGGEGRFPLPFLDLVFNLI